MKKEINYIKVLLTEYFTHPAIYLSFVLFALLCMFGPAITIDDKQYSVLEMLIDQKNMALTANNYQCNSYAVMLNFKSSPWFEVAAPVITSLPALAVFTQNAGDARRHILNRTSKRAYSGGLFWCAYFSGFVIALIGVLLYGAVVFSTFPTASQYPNDSELIIALFGATESERFLNLFKKCVNCCVVSGCFPLLTLVVYGLIHDRFLSLTIPMTVQYVSLKLSIFYSAWLYSAESFYTNNGLNFIYLLFPSSCMQHCYYWENILNLPFWCFSIMSGIIVFALYLIFDKLNRRSIGEGV